MPLSKKNLKEESLEKKELTSEQTLGLVSMSLMQKLAKKDPAFTWLIDEAPDIKNIKKLRDRLELTELALQTGAPLSTSEVTLLMGAKPGKSKVQRGGLLATKLTRNVWKISKTNNENTYWRN